MLPIEPESRDAVIVDFLESRRAGAGSGPDGDALLGQLRLLGDVRRLEWLSARLRGATS